jgi:hypothetical protein
MSETRASIFDDDTDLDLTDFARKSDHTEARPDKQALRQMAEQKGFSAREAPNLTEARLTVALPPASLPASAPVAAQEPLLQRRYRTGRNRQLNLKVSDDALRRFYALADAQNLVLGVVFEQAVHALEAAITKSGG